MLDAFGADQSIGDFLDHADPSLDHEHLQAVVVIQMDVQRGEHVVEMGVLEVRQFFVEEADVMVVDQGDGSDYVAVRTFPGLLYEDIAYEVAKCFGAIGVSAGSDQLIKLLQQFGIDGHSDPAEFAHFYDRVTGGEGDRLRDTL